jgi:hypothetical protein
MRFLNAYFSYAALHKMLTNVVNGFFFPLQGPQLETEEDFRPEVANSTDELV